MDDSRRQDDLTTPFDDGTPDDSAELWRRVLLQPTFIVEDGNTGTYWVSSAAFDDPELSVAVANEALTVDYLVSGHEPCGVVAFSAGFARSLGQTVMHDAWPNDPAHALVLGEKSRSVRRAFARHVRWRHRPHGHDKISLPDPE